MRCLLCLAALALVAADWPQFRGPNRDGHAADTGLKQSWPADGPPLIWTFKEAGTGYAGPAVVGDRLYTCGARGGDEFAFALDLSGAMPKELWSAKIGPAFTWKGNVWNRGPNVTPTVADGRLYALGGFGDLVCLDAATGKEVWRVNLPRDLGGEVNPIGGGLEQPTPLGWGYAGAPLVDGNRVVCVPGGPRGLLAALDRQTGKPLWQSKEATDQASYSSPVAAEVGGARQYVQAVNAGVVGIAADTGKVLWRYTREPAYDDVVIATPIVHDGYIFTSVGFTQGCDLIRVTGDGGKFAVEKLLSNRTVQNRDGGLVRVGDHLYGHSENRGWVCVELKTGQVVWAERDKLPRGSITFADGRLYCCGEQGTVVLLEPTPKGWTEAGRFKLPAASKQREPSGSVWTHPVVANGRLYLRDQEMVYCYDVRR